MGMDPPTGDQEQRAVAALGPLGPPDPPSEAPRTKISGPWGLQSRLKPELAHSLGAGRWASRPRERVQRPQRGFGGACL